MTSWSTSTETGRRILLTTEPSARPWRMVRVRKYGWREREREGGGGGGEKDVEKGVKDLN